MKIKKLEKAFNKMVKEEIDKDLYVQITNVNICRIFGKLIILQGDFRSVSPEGKVSYLSSFKLKYSNGKSLEFIKGMFYTTLKDIWSQTDN